ncbi:hypothetical protein ACIQWR_05440 [Streptomyces sp. NPDC098789]
MRRLPEYMTPEERRERAWRSYRARNREEVKPMTDPGDKEKFPPPPAA